MVLRAVWIVPITKDTKLPSFVRYFPTVELRCQAELRESYVKIPHCQEFVTALFDEVGVTNGDIFIESRDRCDKDPLFPSFELTLKNGYLWPVVVLERKSVLYCALPFEKLETYKSKSFFNMMSISIALEVLNGLVQCVLINGNNLKLDLPAVKQYVNISLPFGRPVCCDPKIASSLIRPTTKGKSKQPIWNAVPYKGKPQIIIHIKEEIRYMQFGRPEFMNVCDVTGTVCCNIEVEGLLPEISISLVNIGNGADVSVSHYVNNMENKNGSLKLRFYPGTSEAICTYMIAKVAEPPIFGILNIKIIGSIATVLLKLQLRPNIKNIFQQLEVKIPFAGYSISSIKPNQSQGTVQILEKNVVVWSIGTKFPSKSLEVNLNCVAKLKSEMINLDLYDSLDNEIGPNTCALLSFRIPDDTFTGIKVDPQAITVSTASKVRCSIDSECMSGVYKIWNCDGELPVFACASGNELGTV